MLGGRGNEQTPTQLAAEPIFCPGCRNRARPILCVPAHVYRYEGVQPVDGATQAVLSSLGACGTCGMPLVILQHNKLKGSGARVQAALEIEIIHPRISKTEAPPPGTPDDISAAYVETMRVLEVSQVAGAAMLRRLLQLVLRKECGTSHLKTLHAEIEHAAPQLPPHISGMLLAVKEMGNFGAHPTKDVNSGSLIEVEPGETSVSRDVLTALLRWLYVERKEQARLKESINDKLKAAGKAPLP